MGNDLSLHATFTLRDEELLLTYEVKNRSKRDAYLINRLYSQAPIFEFSPDIVYVDLDPITKTIRFYKNHPTQPMDEGEDGPTSLITAHSSPVRAGTSFQEDVHIQLPVYYYNGYGHRRSSRIFSPATYKHVNFSVAYRWRPEWQVEEVHDLYGTPTLMPVDSYLVPRELWGVLETDRINLKVPVVEPG